MRSGVACMLVVTAAAAMVSFAAAAGTPDAERGQQLYENQCQECHDSIVHVRGQHKVTQAAQLRPMVNRWQSNAKLLWNDVDIDDVTCYLNRAFYHFHQPVTGDGSGC